MLVVVTNKYYKVTRYKQTQGITQMTQAQKIEYDKLYNEFLNGAAHQQIKRTSINPIKADDAYAKLIQHLAKTTA